MGDEGAERRGGCFLLGQGHWCHPQEVWHSRKLGPKAALSRSGSPPSISLLKKQAQPQPGDGPSGKSSWQHQTDLNPTPLLPWGRREERGMLSDGPRPLGPNKLAAWMGARARGGKVEAPHQPVGAKGPSS